MSKSKPNVDARVTDIFTECRIWKETMDGCEILINSYMLDPQYEIPSTLPYSSRLIKSASKRGKTQEHEATGICLHIISIRSAQKCTFTYACTLPLGRSLDMQQPSYTLLEFQLKGNPDGKGISPWWILLFPLLFTMYLCAISGPLDRSRLVCW